ncbi:MAG: type II toxin-antitoxin system VapB family antitoxin [Methylococcales bacterium]|nr:type II toxin-antitoxin system VapB family antitoxin [Methylococcales bacterium]
MTTITLDDNLINQVIAKSHYQNAQEAISKILSDYLQQPKQTNIIELLAMPEIAEIEFNPPKLNTPLCRPANLS